MWYWSLAIPFWQLSIDHFVNVLYTRCALAKTRLRHPSLSFDSLRYPTLTICRRVRMLSQSCDNQTKRSWPYSMSMGLHYNRKWGLPKTVYQDNWGHGPTLLSSKVTASQINDFIGTSNAWWLNRDLKNNQRFCEVWSQYVGKNTAYRTRNLNVTSHYPLRSAHDFFNNRVIKYWNQQLQLRVRNSTSINAVKAGLDLFKLSKPDSPNGFWKLSEEIFNRISDKSEHTNYFTSQSRCCHAAKYLFLNISF